MEDDEACNTGLCLGLGIGGYVPKKEKKKEKKPFPCMDLGFELCPKAEAINVDNKARRISLKRTDHESLQHANAKNDSTNNKNGCRKKLRLTKEQSALLEDSFKLHITLNTTEKQALADQLNLKPRQIEVWFQNRRARTKLKQTEIDCELLKKCCENLTEENKRLKKELQELRALKIEQSPLYIQLSKAASLTMCSSCEKLLKPN
ncbi:hypothetical protein L6164_013979 [Bauhinia variegata]|uniref:Uncharacterized protein n=1 Tax=Bauhinia variegata TaxID=167791 RepID=A0ACB9NFR1_BAUVA|nr:hypothetical protein L6164_013979 [Bauhinia variegata]